MHFDSSESHWFGTINIDLRNVTMSCTSYAEIRHEIALIQEYAGIRDDAAAPEGSSTAIPVWAIVIIVAGNSSHMSLF